MIFKGNESHKITLCGFLCSPVYRSSIKTLSPLANFSHIRGRKDTMFLQVL